MIVVGTKAYLLATTAEYYRTPIRSKKRDILPEVSLAGRSICEMSAKKTQGAASGWRAVSIRCPVDRVHHCITETKFRPHARVRCTPLSGGIRRPCGCGGEGGGAGTRTGT